MSDQDERATYDVTATQDKWRKVWDEQDPFRAHDDSPREKRYALTMFPYPSGDLHMGHAEVFALHDVVARYWWQRGYEVLNPMGFDSFGLPAENAAIRNDEHPATYTYGNIGTSIDSCRNYGLSFDWSRTFNTSDPEYYRWTQWLFLKFKERGLAYRKNSPVNWCPNDQTVLANEQVVDGRCERCGAEVTKRELTQWYFRITEYAEELLSDLDTLAPTWPDRVINAQRNWIGRSEGAHVDFAVEGRDEPITVYTTRPDTIFGTTFMVVAVDSPLAEELVTDAQRPAFEAYREETRKETEIERLSTDRPKTGVDLGVTATNPVTGDRIPVWATDYVLADYGTGAVMGVPGGDQRDWEFATEMGLTIVRTTQPPADFEGEAFHGEGPAINSPAEGVDSPLDINGLPVAEAKRATIAFLEERGSGTGAVNFRLRDWLLSRQRYWGAPIPIVHCAVDGEVAGARVRAAGPAARAARRRPEAEGRLAAGRGHGLGEHHLPDLRRTRDPGHRHDGHVRRLVLVHVPLLLAERRHPGVRQRPGQPVDAVRHLHRRRRARGAAPAVRPLLHQGAGRHGPGGLPRAVLGPAEPGLRDQPGQEDEQVAGQRRATGGPTSRVRRGRGAADPGLRRSARGRHRLGRHVAQRFAAVPAARLAAGRRRHLGRGHRPVGR